MSRNRDEVEQSNGEKNSPRKTGHQDVDRKWKSNKITKPEKMKIIESTEKTKSSKL
jgi:hypothetical protein